MATWNDLSIKDKRQYLGWRVKQEKKLWLFFDKRTMQFKDLKDTITEVERNKIKTNGETQLDIRWADINVDNYIIERDAE